jgi:hypothetical protein
VDEDKPLVLGVVSRVGDALDSIAVSTAMSMLCKVAKRSTKDKRSWELVGDQLGADPRFARLMELVGEHCPRFKARAGSNVLNSLLCCETSSAHRRPTRRWRRNWGRWWSENPAI